MGMEKIRTKIMVGDNRETLKTLADNSIDSIVTDPPYELGFMGKKWDASGIAYDQSLWRECLRVLKPGGHLLAFSGSRTYHRMVCAIEDSGFEIRDQIMWVYGCYSEDTEVLTQRGYLPYDQLNINKDKVLQWDSSNNRLSWHTVSELFIYDAPEDMVNIKNRHTDQLLTKNHRVYGKFKNHSRNSYSEWEVVAAENLPRYKVLPLAGALDGVCTIKYPYLSGWWMTDAWIHNDGKAIMFSQSKPKTLEKLRTELDRLQGLGLLQYSEYTKKPKKPQHKVEHTFYVTGEVAKHFIETNPTRDMDWSVLQLTWKDRQALLEGLMDGDGSTKQHTAKTFWSKNRTRLDIVSAVCTTLNIRNHIDYKKGAVYFNTKTNTTELQHKHKDTIVQYAGKKVWCLKTETGAFVVRRNGRTFISGNSGFPKSLDVSKAVTAKEITGGSAPKNLRMARQGEGYAPTGQEDYRAGRKFSSEIEHDNRPTPLTPNGEKWQGWGTALKPSHEPVVWAKKPLTSVPTDLLLYTETNIGALLCLLLSPAKLAEILSTLNQKESGGESVSALLFAEVLPILKSQDGSEKTGMFKLPETERTILSIVESWRRILGEVYQPKNTFTTETATSLITALRTFNSLILGIIQGSTTEEEMIMLGNLLNATTAGAISRDTKPNYKEETSAPENAISQQAPSIASNVVTSFVAVGKVAASVLKDATTRLEEKISPSHEPIVVARKPLIGTVAENVLEHGTGAINIDGCRVAAEKATGWGGGGSKLHDGGLSRDGGEARLTVSGRWPANFIHDMSEEVVACFPDSSVTGKRTANSRAAKVEGTTWGADNHESQEYTDSGSAARFFYCAKASKTDRNEGCGVYSITKQETGLCKEENMELVALLQKATLGLTLRWSIDESGKSITSLSPMVSLSTTLTKISQIIESKTLNWLMPSPINESTAGASSEMVDGGNPVVSAGQLSPSTQITTSEKTESAHGVKAVAWKMLSSISEKESWHPYRNIHSTVKPTSLMRYLCRLVTPPGGLVLDPFMGSGSTGKAAILEGFNFIGCELSREYAEIAEARISHAKGEPLRGLRGQEQKQLQEKQGEEKQLELF